MTPRAHQFLDLALRIVLALGVFGGATWGFFDSRYVKRDAYDLKSQRDSLTVFDEIREIREWQSRRDTVDRQRDSVLRACVARPVRCE